MPISTDVRGAIKTALSTLSANVYDSVPEAPIVPAIVIVPDSPYMELEVLGKVTTRVKLNYTATVVFGAVSAFAHIDSNKEPCAPDAPQS